MSRLRPAHRLASMDATLDSLKAGDHLDFQEKPMTDAEKSVDDRFRTCVVRSCGVLRQKILMQEGQLGWYCDRCAEKLSVGRYARRPEQPQRNLEGSSAALAALEEVDGRDK